MHRSLRRRSSIATERRAITAGEGADGPVWRYSADTKALSYINAAVGRDPCRIRPVDRRAAGVATVANTSCVEAISGDHTHDAGGADAEDEKVQNVGDVKVPGGIERNIVRLADRRVNGQLTVRLKCPVSACERSDDIGRGRLRVEAH